MPTTENTDDTEKADRNSYKPRHCRQGDKHRSTTVISAAEAVFSTLNEKCTAEVVLHRPAFPTADLSLQQIPCFGRKATSLVMTNCADRLTSIRA